MILILTKSLKFENRMITVQPESQVNLNKQLSLSKLY